MIEREYQELFQNQVQAVHPVYKPQDMTKLCKEYEGLRIKLINQVDQYEVKMRKGKKVKRKTVSPSQPLVSLLPTPASKLSFPTAAQSEAQLSTQHCRALQLHASHVGVRWDTVQGSTHGTAQGD